MVLKQMQVLDQEITTAFAIAEQSLHFGKRLGIDLPAFREIGTAPTPGTGMYTPVVLCGVRH
ncbi:MAG: hypothetical protein JO358_10770 [Alphaproteobacteria bacterium]|nr:hypothetical protein [Alphaproteobacteria bacterium]